MNSPLNLLVLTSETRPSGVVVKQPSVEILLYGFYPVVELLMHSEVEELLQDHAVEPLHEAVGVGPRGKSRTYDLQVCA